MDINKNVSIWRGSNTPPTQYHLWQRGDVLLHHNGLEWVENKVPMASPNQNGLMSKEDKDKLDNLVCDSLESDRGDLALSAKQGKILLGKITDLNLSVYQPKGSVQNLADLPVDNLRVGDVYNIVNPFYIEDKKYPAGTNVVWTGSKWDPLGGTVDFSDYSTTEEIEDMIEEQRQEVEGVLQGISLVLYNQHSQLTLKVSPTIIEQGVNTLVTVQWAFKFNDVNMNPDNIKILENATEVNTDVNTKVISRNINSTTRYVAQSSLKGVPKSQQVTVNAYYPMYFGEGGEVFDRTSIITAPNKRPIASSPRGDVSITFTGGQYLWLCVPNTMSVNKVTSSGFAVPMEAPVNQTVNETYKCYRSTDTINEGTVKFTIS